ncbi:MAG TPA: hypothetical protein VF423_00785 [Actinomycetes bacterium]
MTEGPTPVVDGGHLDLDTLADLQEGLLDPPTARAAERHLRDCARCSDDLDELRTVPARLAAADDAGGMPDDVVARLDSALATEGLAAGASGARTVTPVTPIGAGHRSPFGMRILQAAAVIVLLLAGTGIALSALGGGDSANTDAGGADSTAGRAAEKAPGSYPVTASGRNWGAETLPVAVPELVDGTLAPTVTAQRDNAGDDEPSDDARAPQLLSESDAARLAGGPPLAECVTALNDGPITPLAVDLASWQGQPAAVIVLPTPDDPATVDAWVVAPDCSQADARVLHFARVARP